MKALAFTDRVVLVTGGAASLGRGISEDLASRGATVIIADRDIAAARSLEAEIAARGGGCALALEVDVTESESLERMVRAVLDRYGRIDGLVNNAGILGPVKPLWETTDEEFVRVFDLNVRAVFACTRAVVKPMMEKRAGAIVTIASVAGKDGPKDLSIYGASKAAVIGFTKSWAKELASFGVRVNCIAPSLIDVTGMQNEMPQGFSVDSVSRIPMGRPARICEVANVASFLLSDEASFVTAACYDVSGGRGT